MAKHLYRAYRQNDLHAEAETARKEGEAICERYRFAHQARRLKSAVLSESGLRIR
jgi:hypothetical protein